MLTAQGREAGVVTVKPADGGVRRHKRDAGRLVTASIIYLFTLFFPLQGAGSIADALRFRAHAARADGVVIATPFGGHHPEIQFSLPSGEKVAFPQSGMIGGYRKDQHVEVLFDPRSPRGTACIDSIAALLGGGAFAFGFVVIGGILGTVALIEGLRGKPLELATTRGPRDRS